jgi:hypothetical protein
VQEHWSKKEAGGAPAIKEAPPQQPVLLDTQTT